MARSISYVANGKRKKANFFFAFVVVRTERSLRKTLWYVLTNYKTLAVYDISAIPVLSEHSLENDYSAGDSIWNSDLNYNC